MTITFSFPRFGAGGWRGPLAGLALAACVGGAQGQTMAPPGAPPQAVRTYVPPPQDPFEPFNRRVYRFNEGVDKAVLKPAATAYRDLLPQMVRTGVGNFFGNLGDVWSLANNVAQLKLQASAETLMRLNVNTFFGLGGLLDIASEAGISRHTEDFGQTLGYWGVPPGPYLMLPFFGPSTVRDASALPADSWGYPLGHVHDIPVRNVMAAMDVVDARARLLGVTGLLEQAALDPYSFMRDSYLQRRAIEVRDGSVVEEEERYDLD